ncbi:MAG TPA: hypothetical protein VHX17_09130 [Candidatus Cybelea sp.]|jgi:virginiamycin B lyase|nr:hypothetical protein [Candidatus Cybelea sp.]
MKQRFQVARWREARPVPSFSALFSIASLVAIVSCSSSPGAVPAVAGAGLETPLTVRERVRIEEFNDLPPGNGYVSYVPYGITLGPDGALWVTDDIDSDAGESAVVRLSPSGRRTKTYHYSGPVGGGSSLGDITAGPDGALWLTDSYNLQILRLTVQGTYTGFPLADYGSPTRIVTGPDRALWFTEFVRSGADIVRMTTAGATTSYPVGGEPIDIAAGPDGALWFTDFEGAIGRITTSGAITDYSAGLSPGAEPYSIAPGPDGALWFTEFGGGRIGRITTAGKITEYSHGITAPEMPQDLVAGPDGAMWFTEYDRQYGVTNSKIGRITMHGKITAYSKINPRSAPFTIAKGTKGDLWFVETSTNDVGRLKVR